MEENEEYSDDEVQPFTFPQAKPLYWNYGKPINNSAVKKQRPLKRIPLLQNITEGSSENSVKTDSADDDSVSASSLSGNVITRHDKESQKGTQKGKNENVAVEKFTLAKSNRANTGKTPVPVKIQTPFSLKGSSALIKRVSKDGLIYQRNIKEGKEHHIKESKLAYELENIYINEKSNGSRKGLYDCSEKNKDVGGRVLKDVSNMDQNPDLEKNSLYKLTPDMHYSKISNNSKFKMPCVTFREEVNMQNVPSKTPKAGPKITHSEENYKKDNLCTPRLQNGNEFNLEKRRTKQEFNSVANEKCNVEKYETTAVPYRPNPDPSVLSVNGFQYAVLSKLGQGGSSQVYQVLHKTTSTLLAVKCVNLRDADENTAIGYLKEIEMLEKLKNSNRVIKLIDHEYLKCHQTLYVVMEKGDTDLSTLLKQTIKSGDVSLPMIIYYWTEMLHAVKEIHDHGIVHADLKPANFLLVCGRLKLIDFGIASSIQTDATSVFKNSVNGTCNYMSPEAIEDPGDSSRMKVGYKSDVWSLGCILYNFLYRKTPFQHITNSLKKLQVITNKAHRIEFPPIKNCPPPLMDALKGCLMYDAKKRPTVAELLAVNYIWPLNQ